MSLSNDVERSKKIREIYRYDEMSNKVLREDKSLHLNKSNPVKDAEAFQPKSMVGRVHLSDMGSKAHGENLIEDRELIKREVNNSSSLSAKPNASIKVSKRIKRGSVLAGARSNSDVNYYPSDGHNSEIYDQIVLQFCGILGSDIPQEIILSAVDFTLQLLISNGDHLGSSLDEKKSDIQKTLSVSITADQFNNILNLCKQITDFDAPKELSDSENDGVAILADDSYDSAEIGAEEENPLLDEIEEDNASEEEENETESTQQVLKGPVVGQAFQTETVTLENDLPSEKSHLNLATENIDEMFLHRLLKRQFEHTETIEQIYKAIMARLKNFENTTALQTSLLDIIGPDNEDLAKLISENAALIYWGIQLAKSTLEEKENLYEQMKSSQLDHLIERFRSSHNGNPLKRQKFLQSEEADSPNKKRRKQNASKDERLPTVIDLNSVSFDQGADLMTTTRINLPPDSFKRVKDNYEEIHIPAPARLVEGFQLVPISQLPSWAQEVFPSAEAQHLNRIQSEVYPSAFLNDDNILICAPTGAGKTNIAMLTILRTLANFRDATTGKISLKDVKVVYIAPLKALVQEQVREFQRRLVGLGVKVAELTGDSRLSRQQIAETNILVSTPEKWDIITRKRSEANLIEMVKLLIIDEVHLLHDSRGPVIEGLVARALGDVESASSTRIVGLSATLPNYEDVAKFMRVPKGNLFYFDPSFRPCPLAQQFCGVTKGGALQKVNELNLICYEKVLESVKSNNQVIVFVHSRKDTTRTARFLKERLLQEDTLRFVQNPEAGANEILKRESGNAEDSALSDLMKYGIGVHHAGLSKSDRSLSEDLFADGLTSILVSTSTLAWGVNLPAHTVIIKGTDLYSPEKGSWTRLSAQDVLQMLGRAGRPRYDTFGEGIIITQQADLQYYLAILNQQLPIESHLISHLPDSLNAEVVLGNIRTRGQAVDWLARTYLFVRMLREPSLYNANLSKGDDPTFNKYREDLVHSAFVILKRNGLLTYDIKAGTVSPTEIGRIASYFYIGHSSVSMYARQLNQRSTLIDLFKIFAMSEEFKYIPVRPEERLELKNILERAPVPVTDSPDDPLTKVNLLLQIYVSRLKLDGFALNADMIYITQSATRLIRAMFELSTEQGWPRTAKKLLNLCKSVSNRLWFSNTPLRQFPSCPAEVIRRAEASSIPWSQFLSLETPQEVGKALRSEKHGKAIFDLIRRFPKLNINCTVQTITPTWIKFELEILADWLWDTKLHGFSESFFVLAEDFMGEKILFHDVFTVKANHGKQEQYLEFTIPIELSANQTLPPNIFISFISEKWLHCESRLPVLFDEIKMPKRFPAPTLVFDEGLVGTENLEVEEYIEKFEFQCFNQIQSQVFPALYQSNESVFIGAPKGSGKTALAELALLNLWRQQGGRAVYIHPNEARVRELCHKWNDRFSTLAGGKVINNLTDDLSENLKLLAHSHVVLATCKQFDTLTRRWKQRKNVQSIELLILDDSHYVGSGLEGAMYENIVSRMRFISTNLSKDLRIISLSNPIGNSRDFGAWLGISKESVFNFPPTSRIRPLQVQLQVTNSTEAVGEFETIIKSIEELSFGDSCIIFASSHYDGLKVCRGLVRKMADYNISALGKNDIQTRLHDKSLAEPLYHGIGLLSGNMNASDKAFIKDLFSKKVLNVAILRREDAFTDLNAPLVVVAGTTFYDKRERRNVGYEVNELLEMIGIARSSTKQAKAIILTRRQSKEYYKKFLSEPTPVESFMYYHFHDVFINEISTGIIETKQDCIDLITYTLFYRRIHANPSYYGVKDTAPEGISAYLTEVVEEVCGDLVNLSVVEIHEGDGSTQDSGGSILPRNNCLIAAHHGLRFATLQIFISQLSSNSSLRNILEVLAKAGDFHTDDDIAASDLNVLSNLYRRLPLNTKELEDIESTAFQTFVLIQAYFTRSKLPIHLVKCQQEIVRTALSLVPAIVDILSGEGHLNASVAMDVSQMLTQGCWDTDSPLKQVPYFDDKVIKKCTDKKIETIYDIMALEDDEREELMLFPESELFEIARFVNNYPNIELSYSVDLTDGATVGEELTVSVTLTRDEEPESLYAVSGTYSFSKKEAWWIFVGNPSTKELLGIKKVFLRKMSQSYDLKVELLNEGPQDFTIWCVCDSYMDADKEATFHIDVSSRR
ncbi:LAMI_0H15038g1_1 [Lachancea mirantina]|uniref:U5 small nuclear ribonucleoprotein 200 kDa helicase n=1 Tax=Lachancea mirantina TaxID=1230905 RepID=A0A1G4KIS8_9SACH|nr:LAMI_0H15038g1_1 [Lachancea mirantina]